MIKKISVAIVFLMVLAAPFISRANDYIKAAVNNPDRPADEVARDAGRKPIEVLSFFGIKPGMKVVDLMSGEGYYTDILRNIVGPKGQVIAHINPFLRINMSKTYGSGGSWEKRLNSESWKKNVTPLISKLDELKLSGELDGAMLAIFYHDTVWMKVDRNKMNEDIFETLKSGGIYAIIDHHALKGHGVQDVKTLHRIEMDLLIQEVEAAGFKLAASSDLLSHPKDTRDYNIFRDYETARDQTDRFVLKFVKP